MYNNKTFSPQPSGRTARKIKKTVSFNTKDKTRDLHEKIVLQQASDPFRRIDPIEIKTRQRCDELTIENEQLGAELQQLWSEKDQLIDQLETNKLDFEQLKRSNELLSETFQNYQMGKTSTTFFADQEIDFQENEKSTINEMKQKIQEQLLNITENESVMTCMKAEFNEQNEEATAKIKALQFQISEAAQELEEKEEMIKEKNNLNQTISEEKSRFATLSEEYKEKMQDYNTQIAKLEAEKTMQLTDYQEKMECLEAANLKSYDEQKRWQNQAEKKSEELKIISKKLNSERAQRASRTELHRKTSINMKLLTKKNQKAEAERLSLVHQNHELEREIATSRIQVRKYFDERKQLSFAQRVVGKLLCGGNHSSSKSQN